MFSFANAVDLGDSVQIHGFASQGALQSSNNNFLASSRSGTLEFTDLGLNANWAINDSLRLGGQAFYRNLGDYSEDRIQVDWALLDYRPFNMFGVRLGKVKLPIGLYNETRDSDFLRSTIFLPQSIYDESRRDTNLAYVGAGVYGSVPLGAWGDLDYHLFIGETDYPKQSILAESTEQSLLSSITKNNNLPVSKRNPQIPSVLTSSERKSEGLYGGAVVFSSAVTDLRLGFSLLHAENSIYVNGASQPLTESTIRTKFVLSLEYAWNDWLFVSEYGESDRQTLSAGVLNIDGPSQSWYAMLSYSPFDNWTFTALYDEFYRLKFDKDGETKPQSPAYMGWRKDLGIAVRYDISDNWNLMAEYHAIDGGAMQMSVTNAAGVDRYWNYLATKISYSF